MICKRLHQLIDEYLEGTLSLKRHAEIENHLLVCAVCRDEVEWARSLRRESLALPACLEPSTDLWDGISKRIAAGRQPARVLPLPDREPGHYRSHRPAIFGRSRVAAKLALAAGVLVLLLAASHFLTLLSPPGNPAPGPQWAVTGLAGSPVIESEPIVGAGRLGVGQWIQTDAQSRAQIEVGSIGRIEVEPNTRLGLIRAQNEEHRMALERGGIRALILAPPRLFLVETPSALAVDLGCAYQLSVDENGNGHLSVSAGWVALESAGRESLVPAGAVCISRPGKGPGTPYFQDSSSSFQEALTDFDVGHSEEASLAALLENARVRDSLSLWHLLGRAEGPQRARVYDRLAELQPVPADVNRPGILELDEKMLRSWKEHLETSWF